MHIYMIMNADCNLIYFVYIYMYIRTVNVKCKAYTSAAKLCLPRFSSTQALSVDLPTARS